MIKDIRQRLADYVPVELPPGTQAPGAAVLIPIYMLDDEIYVILTKRTDTVEHHKGEISFPGGVVEPEDASLEAAALRESLEEIGLEPAHVEVLGRIDNFTTRQSSFTVAAFVGFIEAVHLPYQWRPAVEEVAVVLEVPVTHLLDPANVVSGQRQMEDGSVMAAERFIWREHSVIGATARGLRNFLDVAVRGAVASGG